MILQKRPRNPENLIKSIKNHCHLKYICKYTNMFMRLLVLFLFALITPVSSPHAQTLVNSFDDISYWVGTGSNRAGIVIDWKDGKVPTSLAWGFRWNGAATGEDMILAIAGSIGTTGEPAPNPGGDPALTLYTIFFSGFGSAVQELQYDSGGGQQHQEGGFSSISAGFWSYWTSNASLTLPTSWVSSEIGMGARELTNNSWDGWSWAADFVGVAPDQPISAVPESGTFVLLIIVAGGWILIRARSKMIRS